MNTHLLASLFFWTFLPSGESTSLLKRLRCFCWSDCVGYDYQYGGAGLPRTVPEAIRWDPPTMPTTTTTRNPPTTTTLAEKDPIEVDKEAVMCVEKKCAGQLRSLSFNWNDVNERTINHFCDRYGAIKACIATECSITSTVSDFLSIFGTAEFLCSEREALLNHGVCLHAAIKSGHMSLPEPLLTFIQHTIQSEHGSNGRGLRGNRAALDNNEGRKIATLMAKMKLTASYFSASAITCEIMIAARARFVERASDECDQDDGDEDNTKASAFARRAFGESAKQLFNVVKALHPTHNLIDVEACWAKVETEEEEETESSGLPA